jgi:hypothetical protein
VKRLVIGLIVVVAGTVLVARWTRRKAASRPAAPAKSLSDADLRNWVEQEYPALKTSIEDWTRVQVLREFSYRHTAAAMSVTCRAYEAGAQNVEAVLNGRKSLGDGFQFFEQNGGGVVGGHMAQMLAMLYRLFGFQHAWIMRIGFVTPSVHGSRYCHMQNLVRIHHEGKVIYVVNDAMTNSSYCGSDGITPMDYRDLIGLLVQKRHHAIRTIAGINGSGISPPAATLGFVADQPDPQEALGSFTVDRERAALERLPQGWVYRSPRTLARFELLGNGWWKPELAKEGLPAETLYLHLFLYDIQGPGREDSEARALLSQHRQILSGAPSIHFTFAEGFRSGELEHINTAAASLNVKFSAANAPIFGSVSLYPVPDRTLHPDATLCFFPDAKGDVVGRIDFLKSVAGVELDVTFFDGGTVTLTAYTAANQIVGKAMGASHLAISAEGATPTIHHVILTGNSGGLAISIDNLQMRRQQSASRVPDRAG